MIYLDSAATTKVLPCAAKAAYEAMTETYSNPSSLHSFGYEAEKIKAAAEKTATALELMIEGDIDAAMRKVNS